MQYSDPDGFRDVPAMNRWCRHSNEPDLDGLADLSEHKDGMAFPPQRLRLDALRQKASRSCWFIAPFIADIN